MIVLAKFTSSTQKLSYCINDEAKVIHSYATMYVCKAPNKTYKLLHGSVLVHGYLRHHLSQF